MSGAFAGRRVWVTGASSGIGEAVAMAFQDAGAKVALSARSEEALRRLAERAPESSLVVPLDVADLEANRQALGRIESAFGGLDIVFLNAGICEYLDDVTKFEADLFRRHMDVNFMGVVNGIQAALPALRASEHPQIVGMSSTVAWRGVPRGEAYAASKAAIRNMLEGLRLDLLPEKIAVSVVCPGFVKTPLTDKNDFAMPFRIDAEKAAKIILRGIARQKQEISFPWRFAVLARLFSFLPAPVYTWLMKGAVRRPGS